MQPTKIDLSAISAEFTTNYLSYIHLTSAFLPFLQAQKSKTALIYISSNLALIPMVRCPNYCATKAALHHFTMVLRQQLKGSNVKVVEVLPPAVQSKLFSSSIGNWSERSVRGKEADLWTAELHDEKHQPDIKNGGSIGMPLDEFTEEAWEGLVAGDDNVPVGMGKMAWKGFESERQEIFQRMNS
jgi:short-subunit dehydrogenase involved in D-alanine esterification of teichoic acids